MYYVPLQRVRARSFTSQSIPECRMNLTKKKKKKKASTLISADLSILPFFDIKTMIPVLKLGSIIPSMVYRPKIEKKINANPIDIFLLFYLQFFSLNNYQSQNTSLVGACLCYGIFPLVMKIVLYIIREAWGAFSKFRSI